jgi:hypothetical protein
MSRVIEATVLGIVGLAVLVAAGPTLTKLVDALVPLVLVLGIVAVVLHALRYLTRR